MSCTARPNYKVVFGVFRFSKRNMSTSGFMYGLAAKRHIPDGKRPFIESNKFSHVPAYCRFPISPILHLFVGCPPSCVSSNKCVSRSPWCRVIVSFITLLSVQSLLCPLVVLVICPFVMSIQCPLVFVSPIPIHLLIFLFLFNGSLIESLCV